MPAIGHVTKQKDGNFKGQLKTLSFRAPIDILLNPVQEPRKAARLSGLQPDRGNRRRLDQDRRDLGRNLCLAHPVGPGFRKKLYANLGRAAGQDDPDVYAVIWNPAD